MIKRTKKVKVKKVKMKGKKMAKMKGKMTKVCNFEIQTGHGNKNRNISEYVILKKIDF